MRQYIRVLQFFIALAFLGTSLVSCSASFNLLLSPSPTPSQTSIQPKAIYTPEPTPTSTSIPRIDFSGSLFFDYNGSGLWDAKEPPIVDFSVCAKLFQLDWVCSLTDANGNFSFEEISLEGETVYLKFEDPNADEPSLAFRYINLWHGPVVIDAYEMNGILIPEQHLNDTEVLPIDETLKYQAVNEVELGLMQGFLTLPFVEVQFNEITGIWGFDHDGRVGHVIGYDGVTKLIVVDPLNDPTSIYIEEGIGDGHVGWDYVIPEGNYIIAAASGVGENRQPIPDDLTNFALVIYIDHGIASFDSGGIDFQSVYGHLQSYLINTNQKVYRGQIIGLSGNSGGGFYPVSHLHLDFLYGHPNPIDPDDYIPGGYQKDPFGVIHPDVPMNFPELEKYSYWTVFNYPRFAK